MSLGATRTIPSLAPSFIPMWVPLCHHICLEKHSTPYPLLLVFKKELNFALCGKRWWQTMACRFPLCVALVQKTTSSCVARCCFLCVTKRVLICNTIIISKRWWGTLIILMLNLLNFFAILFCRIGSKARSYASKGFSFNVRWTWRCNGKEWFGSLRLKRVLQCECMH